MKKSYLSKQAIAAIVILTLVAVTIPLYIFVLKPALQREETPASEPDIYEPVIEGETRLGTSSLVGKTRGGYVAIYEATLPEDLQKFSFRAKTGDWSFSVYNGRSIMIDGYESIVVGDAIYDVYLSIGRPIATHIAPSTDELIALQKEKAKSMTEKELEEIKGWNQIPITEEDLRGIGIDYTEYGLEDLESADCISFTDADGKTVRLYLGDKTLDGQERYARLEGRAAVYKLDGSRTLYLGKTVYEMMPPVVYDVTEKASVGDYMPDLLQIMRDGQPYLRIQKFESSDVLAADRLTRCLVIKSYETEDGTKIDNLYDTSSEYSLLMYRYFTEQMTGLEVVYAPKSELQKTEDGYEYYAHGAIPDEIYEQYGIDPEAPYRVLSTTKYTDATKKSSVENFLLFSAPFEENKNRYYYVYNVFRGLIVKMPVDFMPFMEEDEDYFMSKYISMLPINSLDTISVDSTGLPGAYLYGGVERFKEDYKLNYKMEGGKRALTASGMEIIEKVTLSDGREAPDVPGGDNAVENFRHLYYHFGSTMMYSNTVKQYLEEIGKVDLDKPGLTLSYSVYGTDRSHTMKFYFFDDSGLWAFYTLDGEGRYMVKTEDLQSLIRGFIAVRDGASVTDIMGPVGS